MFIRLRFCPRMRRGGRHPRELAAVQQVAEKPTTTTRCRDDIGRDDRPTSNNGDHGLNTWGPERARKTPMRPPGWAAYWRRYVLLALGNEELPL
ncbi:hypothetical protein BDV93DRAFT_525931 [Ceratobasidium sp. AG-I]|nr:hypothetical protein BDV93DRAFT_525931 [Ceratobasidium sp. AG-I]